MLHSPNRLGQGERQPPHWTCYTRHVISAEVSDNCPQLNILHPLSRLGQGQWQPPPLNMLLLPLRLGQDQWQPPLSTCYTSNVVSAEVSDNRSQLTFYTCQVVSAKVSDNRPHSTRYTCLVGKISDNRSKLNRLHRPCCLAQGQLPPTEHVILAMSSQQFIGNRPFPTCYIRHVSSAMASDNRPLLTTLHTSCRLVQVNQ